MLDARALGVIDAVLAERDVHGVRVAEQVVQVAENFLVGPDQKYGEVIRLAVEMVNMRVLFTSRRSMN